MTMTEQVHSGQPINQLKYLPTYLTAAALWSQVRRGVESTCIQQRKKNMEFSHSITEKNSKTKPLSKLQSPPPETLNQANENLKLFYWTFMFSQKLNESIF